MINVIPNNDEREHSHFTDCWCEPWYEFVDDAGKIHSNGPLIVHNAADHREFVEQITGDKMSAGQNWSVFES